jgi:two-component system, sensor histidine kinase
MTTKLHQKIAELERTHADLTSRERELRLITDSVPVLISFLDRDQRFRFANEQHQRWFGRTPEELNSKTLAQVLGAQAYAEICGFVQRAIAGETVSLETSIDFADSAKYVRATFVPGNGSGVIALMEDLTELRTTEMALRAANEALRKSNELLTQFAHAAAHDLREPSLQVALLLRTPCCYGERRP